MKNTHTSLVFFSPTRTTATILRGVASGLSPKAPARECDLTPPDAPVPSFDGKDQGEVAVIGVPVYSGRVPREAAKRLRRIKANGTPAVLVVVYGNRAFEDALVELRDIATECGFRPLAGAAFIGEHSFSNAETPIAHGRPDDDDLALALALGQRAAAKLAALDGPEALSDLVVPGNTPYRDGLVRPPMTPEVDTARCTVCGTCVEVCPTGAIKPDQNMAANAEECIICMACVRACPEGARAMMHPDIQAASQRLHTNCSERKEPELFL